MLCSPKLYYNVHMRLWPPSLITTQHLQVQYKHPGAGTCGWLQWTQELLYVLLQGLSKWGWGISTDWLQLWLCLYLEGVWRDHIQLYRVAGNFRGGGGGGFRWNTNILPTNEATVVQAATTKITIQLTEYFAPENYLLYGSLLHKASKWRPATDCLRMRQIIG